MIEIINFSDKEFQSQFAAGVDSAYTDVQKILDNIPEKIDINFTDNGASDITGVGGFSFSRNQINLAVSKDFGDRDMQMSNLRSTVFHESFHVQQGFTYSDSPFTALDAAVYEGSAIAFERDYAHNSAAYGDYSSNSEEQLKEWLDEIRTVGTDYFENEETWHKWAFYHPEYDEKWIIYKVGSWLVDNILLTNHLGIIDLKDKSADGILELA